MTLAAGDEAGAALEITVSAARYEPGSETHWRARDLRDWHETVKIHPPRLEKIAVADGLQLVVFTRPARDGIIAVTLTLLNTLTAVLGDKDGACWFRPTLAATAVNTRLRERPASVGAGIDELEVASQRLLFRDVRSFAVGHGCAVAWDGNTPERITTTFLPRHELLLSEAAGADTLDLSMDALANDDSFDVLDRLIADYREWITSLEPQASTKGLAPEEIVTLHRHIREAHEAADRMASGLELLRTDGDVARAFQLTNLAMAQQRSRQHHHRSGGKGDPPSTSAAAWRPFQIAFILTNLRGLADPHHRDRGIADLLWFPTGGGKTEAYLGIIGIAILLRRLRDPAAAGVSVLMRYTLRLLTLQQYQRATGLICALEKIRSDRLPDTGPISIGLWVGGASTPNTIEDARRSLDKARKPGAADIDDDRSDPVQLRQCPWCGHALDYRNYAIVDKTWMRVACGEPTCAFRHGLPVHIVDEDVYTNRPSLVIGTVDKFAMMPWKREVGSLLGVDSGTHATSDGFHHASPDLIVQDELHLISGPLGTVVGLYETAVDAITSIDAPAKIVASTATIRRASDQVRAVFARDTRQFPRPASASPTPISPSRHPARPRPAANTWAPWPPEQATPHSWSGSTPHCSNPPPLSTRRTRRPTCTGRYWATSTACASSAAPTSRSSTMSRTK